MVFDDVDQTSEALVSAILARNHPGMLSLLRAETRLRCDGVEYRSDGVGAWLAKVWPPGTMPIQPVKLLARGPRRVLTVVGCAGEADGDKAVLLRAEWTITVRESWVLSVDVGPVRKTAVPSVILSYIRATNDFDLNMLLETFADDALVNDQLCDYWGKAAITQWAANEIVGERVTMTVVNVVEHYNSVIVTANVDGDYDKRGLPDPLVLAFYFSSQGSKIVQLIILRNIVDV